MKILTIKIEIKNKEDNVESHYLSQQRDFAERLTALSLVLG
jgi:hypothetical protein